MKKIALLISFISILFSSHIASADFDKSLNMDPVFMEEVYGFIQTEDMTTSDKLTYCEQVYLEATRRREYTYEENTICRDYFEIKNKEEISYMKYMLNNRELLK